MASSPRCANPPRPFMAERENRVGTCSLGSADARRLRKDTEQSIERHSQRQVHPDHRSGIRLSRMRFVRRVSKGWVA
jgi:hypothetical protein